MNGIRSGCGNAHRMTCSRSIVVINGKELGEYDSVIQLNFKNGKLNFFSVNDNKIYKVEVEL